MSARPAAWRRRLLWAIVAATVLVSCRAPVEAGPRTPHDLAKRALSALASGSVEAWLPHTLQPADAAVVLPRWRSGPDGPGPYDEAWFATYREQREARQVSDFATVRRHLEGAGARWDDLRVVAVEVRHELKGGATVSDVFATVRTGGADYVIELDDCMRLPRGWIVVDGMRWHVDRPAATPGR